MCAIILRGAGDENDEMIDHVRLVEASGWKPLEAQNLCHACNLGHTILRILGRAALHWAPLDQQNINPPPVLQP